MQDFQLLIGVQDGGKGASQAVQAIDNDGVKTIVFRVLEERSTPWTLRKRDSPRNTFIKILVIDYVTVQLSILTQEITLRFYRVPVRLVVCAHSAIDRNAHHHVLPRSVEAAATVRARRRRAARFVRPRSQILLRVLRVH